jgi:hypothetical protein
MSILRSRNLGVILQMLSQNITFKIFFKRCLKMKEYYNDKKLLSAGLNVVVLPDAVESFLEISLVGVETVVIQEVGDQKVSTNVKIFFILF